MNEINTGILLEDEEPFNEWASRVLPWVNMVCNAIRHATEFGDNVGLLTSHQEKCMGWAFTTVELKAKATRYYNIALRNALQEIKSKHKEEKWETSLIMKVALGMIAKESEVMDYVVDFSETLADHLKNIANRMKLEIALHYANTER